MVPHGSCRRSPTGSVPWKTFDLKREVSQLWILQGKMTLQCHFHRNDSYELQCFFFVHLDFSDIFRWAHLCEFRGSETVSSHDLSFFTSIAFSKGNWYTLTELGWLFFMTSSNTQKKQRRKNNLSFFFHSNALDLLDAWREIERHYPRRWFFETLFLRRTTSL